MVLYVYLIILILSAIFFRLKFKRLINFAFIFNAVWCIFGAVSTFGVFDMRIPVTEIHIYAWTFVGIVDIIILFFAKNEKYSQVLKAHKSGCEHYSFKYANFIQVIALFLISVLFFKSLVSFVKSGDFSEIRGVFFGQVFESMYVDFLLRSVPVAMLEGLIVFYVFTAFITGETERIFFAAINCFIVTVCNGGRYTLLLFIYAILICLVTLNWKGKLRKKNRQKRSKIFKIIIIVAVLSVFAITAIRGQNVSRNIISYYSGSLSFLDRILQDKQLFGFDEGLTYGYLTFGAFIEPIVLYLKAVFNADIEVPAYYFDIYCQKYYNISTGEPLLMNNNTSVLYYFLRDFGEIGIVIGAMFLGTILVVAYNNMRKNKLFSGLFFVYFANVMFNTLMTYQFFGRSPIIIIFTLFLCSRQNVNYGNNTYR